MAGATHVLYISRDDLLMENHYRGVSIGVYRRCFLTCDGSVDCIAVVCDISKRQVRIWWQTSVPEETESFVSFIVQPIF